MIKGIIFDMDGVVINSEPFYFNRLIEFIRYENGVVDEKEFTKVVGTSIQKTYEMVEECFENKEKFKGFFDRMDDFYKNKQLDYNELLFADVNYLIKDLYNKGYKLGLASSSYKKTIEQVLDVTGLNKYFIAVVSGEDFEYSKPDPAIYLKTAKALNIEPSEILAIEDSSYGIEAAKRAGMTVVARKDELFDIDQSKADYIYEDLRNVKLLIDELNRSESKEFFIQRIQYGTKEYIKALYIRNQENEGKSYFSMDMGHEKDKDLYGIYRNEQLIGVYTGDTTEIDTENLVLDADSRNLSEFVLKILKDKK